MQASPSPSHDLEGTAYKWVVKDPSRGWRCAECDYVTKKRCDVKRHFGRKHLPKDSGSVSDVSLSDIKRNL